ncbi:MAG: hypothetical protein AAB425_15200, partial [Bdellovibrionota bacterium]
EAAGAAGGKGKAGANISSEGGGNQAALMDKIKSLEDRLAEYSVIEDDLANLKRLQQENTQLRGELDALKAGGGGAGAGVAAAAAAAKAEPVAENTEAAAEEEPVEKEAAKPEPVAAEAAVEEVSESEKDEGVAAAAAFEGVVDKVEEDLNPGS